MCHMGPRHAPPPAVKRPEVFQPLASTPRPAQLAMASLVGLPLALALGFLDTGTGDILKERANPRSGKREHEAVAVVAATAC